MTEKPPISPAALVALVVAWSAIVFMFGYVVGQTPT